MRSKLVAGNWKMNGSLASNQGLLQAIVTALVALTRAHADDADRSGRALIERVANVRLNDREPFPQPAGFTVVGAMPFDPVVFGLGARDVQPARAFSIESTTSGASGRTSGEKRAITLPSRPTRNFSKFQRMSPSTPSASAVLVSDW